jgi:uncharacterized protein YndB with AHSA1/START domain
MKDETRKIELDIEIAADAAEVWRAVSTAEGFTSWFAPEVAVEPGAGGKVYIKWGEGMEGSSRIEIWEPAQHLRIAQDREEGPPPSMVDYILEGKGGTTVLRLVHSGFGSSASFDDEFNSTRQAWPVFLQMIKHSAERGIGSCRNVTVFRFLGVPREAAFEKLQQRIGGAVDGLVRHFNPDGYLCYEFPEKQGAMLSVFCEKCSGSAMLTLVWLLYDVTAEEAEKVREEWTGIVNELFGQHAAA